MGIYQYIRDAWKKPKTLSAQKERLIAWRREAVTMRVAKPTRLDRARAIGYKAKQGVIVLRQRVGRGGRQRPKIKHGRRPKRFSHRKDLDLSYQTVAEQRAVAKYPNCEVLGSYPVGEDGKNFWYEVVVVDTQHPVVKSDKQLSQVASRRGRVQRGLTSSARKSGTNAKK